MPLRVFSCFGSAAQADYFMRYQALIWHRTPRNVAFLQEVRRYNPTITALMYRELFCVQRFETELQETVGSWDWIDANHPEWFQLDLQGRRVEIPDYPGRWLMDWRNTEWRAFWIEKTLRDVQEGGWDGVFADDALSSLQAHQLPPLQGYATDQDLQAAVESFLKAVTDAFHCQGKIVIANLSNSYAYPDLWARWLSITDGLLEEHFNGESWNWGPAVAQQQLLALQDARRQNKWMLCLTYGKWDDPEKMESSLALYLLGAGPRTLFSYRPYANADIPPWHAIWEQDFGQPLEDAQQLATGIWTRRFQYATVIVNTTLVDTALEVAGRAVPLKAQRGRVVR